MKLKSDTQPLLKQFFSFVSTQFNKQIKAIRVDNGGEFASLQTFFSNLGVLYQHTCTYTPQQNGVVERKHRHLLEMACALSFHAHLPSKFWGACVLHAAYLINRLPTSKLTNKTPYELLFNQPPSYHHLRVLVACVMQQTFSLQLNLTYELANASLSVFLLGKKDIAFTISTHNIFFFQS